MKQWLLITVAVVLVGIFGIAVSTHAADVRSNDNITIESDEVVADDLYVAGKNIRIDGEVQGDVYAAGEIITVNGQIGGDLIVAGSIITVNGTIDGSARVAGQTLNLSTSEINGGVTFFGATLTSEPDSSIGHGLLFFGENATINGSIAHGVTAYGSSVTVNGEIGTNSNINAENISIGNNAVIQGDVEYRSDQDATISDDAQLVGSVERVGDLERFNLGEHIGYTGFMLWSYISALIVGGVLLLLARRPLLTTADQVRARPLACLGFGALAMLVTIPLGFLLLMSIVGIPLGILLWITFGVGLYLSKFIVGIALGTTILTSFANQKSPKLLYSFFFGLTALYVINLVPVLSVFASLAIGSLGLGAILLRIFAGVRSQHGVTKKKKA